MPDSHESCSPSDCGTVSAEGAVVSVVYIDCPNLTTELGAAMGYLFVVETLATAVTVIVCVLLTGGSCRSAWDQTRSVLRAQMATEAAEARALAEEEKARP